jgi:hypothetical protein
MKLLGRRAINSGLTGMGQWLNNQQAIEPLIPGGRIVEWVKWLNGLIAAKTLKSSKRKPSSHRTIDPGDLNLEVL